MQPLASLKALADPIYETFYGLTDQPFSITTDPKFFYLSSSHQRAFSELLNGLRRREGILLLSGETGTGKTTLCRTVLESLGQRTFSAMILNPYMSGAEVFRIVLRDFGLVSHEELRRGVLAQADVPQLLDTLEGFLRSLMSIDSHAVIVLDEAQSLAPQVLDQIRLLTALEKDNRRLVQIVMCGQPTLLNTLKTEPMHALNERITRRVVLAPLASEEVTLYIQHRLAIAGGTDAVSFDGPATKVVAELAHGLPRRINVLCDRALQEGRIEGVNVITAELVKRAARALAGVHEPAPDRPSEALAAVAAPAPDAPVETSTLTLTQIEPKPGRLRRAVLVVIGAALMIGVLGTAIYVYAMVERGSTVSTVPAPPNLDRGQPAGPLPVPPADAVKPVPAPAAPATAPAVTPAAPAAVPPATAPPASGQLPGNPNQLN